MRRAALVVFLLFAPALARAQDDALRKEEAAVQAFGLTHAECQEWTDACVVCRRTPEGPACSTPGIACAPRETACRATPAKR